jgi:hypothetical protein
MRNRSSGNRLFGNLHRWSHLGFQSLTRLGLSGQPESFPEDVRARRLRGLHYHWRDGISFEDVQRLQFKYL